jgi:hypothetical protein
VAKKPRVSLVEVKRQADGGWSWRGLDAQRHVIREYVGHDYATKYTATRGARRACGPRVTIVYV